MHFEKDYTYHIYNRSNEKLFYSRDNYIFFIKKLREYILPNAHILCYCLMPNHFHLIIRIKHEGALFFENKRVDELQYISRSIGTLQSSYTQALNKQIGRRGSLFAHKAKAKLLTHADNNYALNCFMYIHQNPLVSELVEKIEDWEFSSFPEFAGKRNGTLVDVKLALETLHLESTQIYDATYQMINNLSIEDFS